MKTIYIVVLGILIPASVFAYTSPGKPTGHVNDFANVLSSDVRTDLENKLQTLEQATGAQVAVVTITALGDETVESYAVALFQEWGIGDKEKDTGLLVLIAPNDHAVRIEVGYGLEGALTDLQAGTIIRNVMVPAFQEEKYDEGVTQGVDAVSAVISGSPEAEAYLSAPADQSSRGSDINFGGIFFLIIIALNVLSGVLGKTKSWWLGGVIGAGIGLIVALIWGFLYIGVSSIVILTILGLLFDWIVSKKGGGHGSGGIPLFFGGMGGRSGGSSFGGFGGGMSGGGGASGRW